VTLLPRVRHQLRDAAERRAGGSRVRLPRVKLRFSYLVPVVGVLVVLVVAAVFISVGGSSRSAGSATVKVTFRAVPTSGSPVRSTAAVTRTAEILRERLGSVFHDSQVTVSGSTLVVTVQDPPAGARARILAMSVPGQLVFFDWETSVLAPDGKPVAEGLQSQSPSSLAISQGRANGAAGDPGAGGMTLYAAVSLASRQPAHASRDNSRPGSQYYLFGAPGSPACATAARAHGKPPVRGAHCLLAGPVANQQQLHSWLPVGVRATQGQELVIPRGTVVLQAADADAGHQTAYTDPSARFFVARDHAALFSDDITSPRQSTDAAGNPDVTFRFTATGARAFQRVTAALARRGALVSGLGLTLNQHFAVALDNKLLTVPSVDAKTYPDGISGAGGADITGGLTVQSARDLATQLRFGALPMALAPQ
jgi:SecD/SecF fusion protein